MKLTNLSGIDWYDGEVWYSDVPNGDLNGDVDFGTLKVGETKTVKTKGAYFYVCIKNSLNNDVGGMCLSPIDWNSSRILRRR